MKKIPTEIKKARPMPLSMEFPGHRRPKAGKAAEKLAEKSVETKPETPATPTAAASALVVVTTPVVPVAPVATVPVPPLVIVSPPVPPVAVVVPTSSPEDQKRLVEPCLPAERIKELRRYFSEVAAPCGCVFLGSERAFICWAHMGPGAVNLSSDEVDILAGIFKDRAAVIPRAALSPTTLDLFKKLRLVD